MYINIIQTYFTYRYEHLISFIKEEIPTKELIRKICLQILGHHFISSIFETICHVMEDRVRKTGRYKKK